MNQQPYDVDHSRLDVACVIPTHHRDESLARALEATLTQTHRPTQVIVVDDTGRESTRKVVEARVTDDVEVLYVDASGLARKGAGASRNMGATFAEASLIAFLDDDDWWEPEYLAQSCKELAVSSASVVLCHSVLSFGNERLPHMRPSLNVRAPDALSQNPGITGSNLILKLQAFRDVGGFDTSLWVAEDQDLLYRLLSRGMVLAVVERDLVVQHAGGQDHLSSPSARHAEGVRRFLNKHQSQLTREDRRFLRLWFHRASRFSSQRPALYAYHTVVQALLTPPAQILGSIGNRLRRRDAPYR
jgi:cellulose synthase/poly-beta-1,6-N-acetylglucosamine synthase-like glycosyltransferase